MLWGPGKIHRKRNDTSNRDRTRKRQRLIDRAQALIYSTTLIEDLRAPDIKDGKDYTRQEKRISVHIPILGLYGEKSDALPAAQQLFDASPYGTLKLFSHRTHALLWEETSEITRCLCQWVKDLSLENSE